MVTRKQLRRALFERLQAKVPGIKEWSLQDLSFDDVKQKPAATLLTLQHTPEQQRNLPAVWTMALAVRIYVSLHGQEESPDDVLDDFVDAVEAALKRQAGEAMFLNPKQTTLGGICQRCWVSGEVQFWSGKHAGDAIAEIPISILCTPEA